MPKNTMLNLMCGEIELKAAAETDGKPAGPPTFDVVAYTGGAMEIEGYDLPVVVDLAGLNHGRSIVANLDHERKQRVGHVTSIANDGRSLVMSGKISAATSFAEEVVASAERGFQWQASIEAKPTKINTIKAKHAEQINGQQITGPAYVVRASTLKGFAFVSHGADDDTSVMIAASDKTGVNKMTPELTAWIENIGLDPEELSADQLKALEANYKGQQAAKAKPKSKVQDVLEAKKAETARQDEIAAIAEKWIDDRRGDTELICSMAEAAIKDGKSVTDFRLELYESAVPEGHTVMSSVRDKGRQISNRLLEAALCKAGNLSSLENHFSDQELDAVDKRFPRGIGLNQLFVMAAQANGLRDQYASQVTPEIMRYAWGAVPVHAAGFSTIALPNILSASANKFLLDGWGSGDMAWSAIAGRKSVRNFQTHNYYRFGGNARYELVPPTGDIKHGEVTEDTYTLKADTYGRILAISRTDFINDDIGAFSQVPFELGVAGIDSMNDVFWTLYLDNTGSFYTAGNNNVSTGAGSALASAGLSAAEVVMVNQTKPNGEPLGVMPAILMIPPTLWTTARELMQSTLVVTGTNSTIPNANIWQGRFVVVTSPYMENSSYTGYSTAAWYLLASPMRLATVHVGFLNGRETPIIETADADFGTLGVQMRAYHDFGVAFGEPRGGVRSAGS